MTTKPTDETILLEDLKRIHRLMTRYGTSTAENRLAERESALAGYVLFSAYEIAEKARTVGAPEPLVEWIQVEVKARMLVTIEAMNVAHYQLWRDLMGDPVTDIQPPSDTEGADHERE